MIAILTFLLCTVAFSQADKLKCTYPEKEIKTSPHNWADMRDGGDKCVNSMRAQIQKELNAAMQYLAMGAHFSRDVKNRPGFAKMFFEAASEERGHAIKLISYLLMRGELISDVSSLISTAVDVKTVTWNSGVAALKDALQLEANVTHSIKQLIKDCETQKDHVNDYHLVDYLTGEFLEEQYKGQRDIAGRISTLDKFMERHGALGEFLYDKKLLSNEV